MNVSGGTKADTVTMAGRRVQWRVGRTMLRGHDASSVDASTNWDNDEQLLGRTQRK